MDAIPQSLPFLTPLPLPESLGVLSPPDLRSKPEPAEATRVLKEYFQAEEPKFVPLIDFAAQISGRVLDALNYSVEFTALTKLPLDTDMLKSLQALRNHYCEGITLLSEAAARINLFANSLLQMRGFLADKMGEFQVQTRKLDETVPSAAEKALSEIKPLKKEVDLMSIRVNAVKTALDSRIASSTLKLLELIICLDENNGAWVGPLQTGRIKTGAVPLSKYKASGVAAKSKPSSDAKSEKTPMETAEATSVTPDKAERRKPRFQLRRSVPTTKSEGGSPDGSLVLS